MIDFIKTIFKEGDQIFLTQNGNEIGGKILNISDAFLAIETVDGNIIGVKGDAIECFSKESLKNPKKIDNTPKGSNKVVTNYQVYGSKNVTNSDENYSREVSSQKPKQDFKQYKPGDKIPLEYLAQRDPSLITSWKKKKDEQRCSKQIKEKVKELYQKLRSEATDLNLVVPAFGAIVDLKPSFQFGFIDDMQTGVRYFFNRGDIVDPELINESGEGIEVMYLRSSNHKGVSAKCVMKSHTIEDVLQIVMRLVNEDDFVRAKQVLEICANSCPKSNTIQQMNELLSDLLVDSGIINSNADDILYSQARKALESRDYDNALKLYEECIKRDIRKVSSIKEMARVYVSLHAQEEDEVRRNEIRGEGLAFINEYKSELPDKSSTNFSLENIYFALEDYDKHIDIVEDIISECGSNGDIPQYLFYLNKAAQSYLRLGDLARATDAANQGLEVDPNNAHLLKTKAAIDGTLDSGSATSMR